MKDTELKRMRDHDLYRTFTASLRDNTFISTDEAADYARRQPAPQYYISARTASLLIRKIEKRISLLDLNSNSRRRIWHIYSVYREYLKQHPGCTTSRELILEEIVENQAPEFFVSLGRAKHIILYERKEARRKQTVSR